MKAEIQATPEVAEDAFAALCRAFPLRPIKSDADHDRAIATINSLIDKDELTPDEDDYLEVLGMIVERHETMLYGEPTDDGSDDNGEAE